MLKPVLVLQHIDGGGPGLFAQFLRQHDLPSELRRPDRGDEVPSGNALHQYAGVCLCGGTQGANDGIGWIRDELALIEAAAGSGMPVIGHCLGGQLIARALGGSVQSGAYGEFGWQPLRSTNSEAAADWIADLPGELVAMQWHYDAFTPPPQARPLLAGRHCEHQAFVIGNMLAMQFHVELTPDMIRHWAVDLEHLIPPASPGVQSAAEVLAQIDRNFPISRRLAQQLYESWITPVLAAAGRR